MSRSWRLALRATGISSGDRILEVGVGGGAHLVPLAAHGFDCVGVDCSSEVLNRARGYVMAVEAAVGRRLPVALELGEFPGWTSSGDFDLACHFGVVEHLLTLDDRAAFHRGLALACKPGGYVVEVVPSGVHPLRAKARSEGLGGYVIPEVDYSPEMLANEMETAGLVDVKVWPLNLFGYRKYAQESPLDKLFVVGGHAVPRFRFALLYRHATAFLAVARTRDT